MLPEIPIIADEAVEAAVVAVVEAADNVLQMLVLVVEEGKEGKVAQSNNHSITAAEPRTYGNWVSSYNPIDPKAPKLPSKDEIKAVIPKECFE